jgi:hypothetical protein
MIIPRGVNLFPSRIQELVLGIPGLSPHFQCVLSRNGNLDAPTVRIERDEQATIDMARNAGRRVGGPHADHCSGVVARSPARHGGLLIGLLTSRINGNDV